MKWVNFGKALEMGIDQYNQKQFTEAEFYFHKASRINDIDFAINFWLLRTATMLCKYAEAETYATKCSKIAPDLEESLIVPWRTVVQVCQQNSNSLNYEELNKDADELLEHYQRDTKFSLKKISALVGVYIAISFLTALIDMHGFLSSVSISVLNDYVFYLAWIILYYFCTSRLTPNLWLECNRVFVKLGELASDQSFRKVFVIYFLLDIGPFILKKLVSGQIMENFPYIFKVVLDWPVFCLLGPIGEEMIFRGLLFKSILKYNAFLAYFITATLFYFYHGIDANPMQVLFSLLFCWSYQQYRSLAAPIALHVFHNTAIEILAHW